MTGVPLLAPLALALSWMLGGIALRLVGGLAFWAGLVGPLVTGEVDGALVALVGGLVWLLGHFRHALRHGDARSSLARTILGSLAGLLRR